MLNVIMLNVIKLNVTMLILLNIFMVNIMNSVSFSCWMSLCWASQLLSCVIMLNMILLNIISSVSLCWMSLGWMPFCFVSRRHYNGCDTKKHLLLILLLNLTDKCPLHQRPTLKKTFWRNKLARSSMENGSNLVSLARSLLEWSTWCAQSYLKTSE